jgi:hypothetical protein
MRLFGSLLCLLVSCGASAGETWAAYQAQKISVRGIKDIKIVGVRGHLTLRGRNEAHQLSLRVRHSNGHKYDDWYLSVEPRKGTLYIEVFNVAYGAQWRNQVREELWPEFDIELEGTALPTTVGWREGALTVSDWDADLEASFLKGQATVQGGYGRLSLQPIQANVQVSGHAGPVNISGESGSIRFSKTSGPLHINWITGAISLKECVGEIRVESRDGRLDVDGGEGILQVQMTQGVAHIAAFRGEVNGQGDKVSWEVAGSAPTRIHLQNHSGPVGLSWNSGGAQVLLRSNHGAIDILHSDFLNSEWHDGQRVASGVKRSTAMGQVDVRTDSGPIRWRQ